MNTATVGAFVLLGMLLVACTFLVWAGDVDGETFMAVVIGPSVGGLIGFVAGTKGVQQGSQASSNTTPGA